jgi:hypothetical protein
MAEVLLAVIEVAVTDAVAAVAAHLGHDCSLSLPFTPTKREECVYNRTAQCREIRSRSPLDHDLG